MLWMNHVLCTPKSQLRLMHLRLKTDKPVLYYSTKRIQTQNSDYDKQCNSIRNNMAQMLSKSNGRLYK